MKQIVNIFPTKTAFHWTESLTKVPLSFDPHSCHYTYLWRLLFRKTHYYVSLLNINTSKYKQQLTAICIYNFAHIRTARHYDALIDTEKRLISCICHVRVRSSKFTI